MGNDQTATVVVAAVIVQDGKVLLKQRKESSTPENVGKWEFPGGKVRGGEGFIDALKREVSEELNLEVRIGRLLHSQVNTYSDGVDYLVLFYACTLFRIVKYSCGLGTMFVEPSKVSDVTMIFGILPGTVEAISHLGEVTELRGVFSFVQSDVANQTSDETLHVMTYELGSLIAHHHKTKRYGEQGYLGSDKKELAGLVSMCRMYCEQRGWDFDELIEFGEEDYLERMKDLKKYGVSEHCVECERILPMYNPECSQNEKTY